MGENFHVEIHGISGGQKLHDLKDIKTGLYSYLKDAYRVNWLVTAITENTEINLGRTYNEEGVWNLPYVRLYHDCDNSVMVRSAIRLIRDYPGMLHYGIQVVRMDKYIPPDRGEHLP
jgi:hypothetical protein